MKPARRTVRRRAGTRALAAALGAGLAALAVAACSGDPRSGDPKYYDYDPHTNSNNWPYRVTYRPIKISYDEGAHLLRIEGIYKPFPPVSNCAEPTGPQYMIHEVPFDPLAEDPFARARKRDGDGVQYSDASPITEEQFHDMASNWGPMDSTTLAMDDATVRLAAAGGYISQYDPPPYSIECGIVGASVYPDATDIPAEHHEGPLLLCGVCGESRCGDGICDWTTEDATNCYEDCYPRWY